MAKLNICNVVVKDNPCPFLNPFQFEITFECIDDLHEDLEWKIIYVGSAESEEYDQTLDTVVVGPIIAGRHMFVFEADPPDPAKIPREDVVGVTVVLLTCAYRSQEFIRVGYYVNNEYNDPELKENPPLEPDFSKLQRNILATCPRVTRFKIDWGDSGSENMPPPSNTENESNHMSTDQAGPSSHKCALREEMLEKTLKGTTLPGHTGAEGALAFSTAPEINGFEMAAAQATVVEPMQM